MSAEIVEDKMAETPVAPATAKSNRKLFLVAGGAAALLLVGGGTGAFFLMGSSAHADAADGKSGAARKLSTRPGEHGESGDRDAKDLVDVPSMVVNLRSPDGASRFLKLHFMLVPGPNGTVNDLKDKLPLILDAYQPFLRELRPEDLAGSAAVFRMKEEMLVRANQAVGAGSVSDILIQDLVQQ